MPQPVLTKAEVRSMVLEGLNLSKGVAYGTFDNSPLFKTEFIDDQIFQADIEVVKAITRSPGHPRRNEYALTFSTISTPGVRVPLRDTHHHLGEVISVDITRNDAKVVVGKLAPAWKITEWLIDKASYGGDDCVDGYYDIANNDFIFTGTSASVRALNIAPHTGADTNLYAPFEYKITVYRLAMGELLKKDPGMQQLASEFLSSGYNDLLAIVGGDANLVPTISAYQQTR